jgi:hypothetical protein
VRLTSHMTRWDGAAGERLHGIITELRSEGVIDLLERVIARVWEFNVDRFEPTEIGDTNRSLGITATENIRSLILRESRTEGNPAGLGDSVKITAPNDSLLIQGAGVSLHVMKSAAAVTLAEPLWDGAFAWKGDSDVRIEAAAANAASYNVAMGGPGSLFEGIFPPIGDVSQLRETFLVWAGGSDSPYTGGWIGLPTLGERQWLAVENLWWHQGGGIAAGSADSGDSIRDAFSDRDVPSPLVSLKQLPKTAGQ